MAQQLLNAVIHKLEKETGAPAHIIEAQQCLDITDTPLKDLVNQVHAVYANREAKSYGKFDPELNSVSAEPHLSALKDSPNPDFLALSKIMMQVLKDKADAQNFATGGHVLMAESAGNGARWFVVAILNSKSGTAISEDLRVMQAPHLDVEGIRFAGRVNFTDWTAGTERYISFLKGKSNDVSQYFQKFLGCSTVQQDLQDTRNLVKAVKQFATDQGLSDDVRETLLKEVYRVADERATQKMPLDLSELSNRVWPADPDALRTALATSNPPIADGFVPRKRGLDGLTRFSAKASNWKLEFDREAIQDHTIEFNDAEGTITIRNLPADVLANLMAEFSVSNQPEAEEAADHIHPIEQLANA